MTTGERNREIVEKLLDGSTYAEVAKEYNLSKASIRSIRYKAISRGAGDKVEGIIKTTGLDKAVKFIAGEDCGCDERQAKLNKLFPSKATPKCMTEEQYKGFAEVKDKAKLTGVERKFVAEIHAHLFSHRFIIPCSCSPATWVQWVSDINQVYQTYQD
jgi:hypothetical protein